MAQRKTYGGPTRLVAVRVPVFQHERFREVAEADHRTVSQELRRLIEMRVTEADEQAAA